MRLPVLSNKHVGLTSTIPVEVVFAAGLVPVDLNNIFISARHRSQMITCAEEDGFHRNICTWIKGIYAAALESAFTTVIGVGSGDCSNTVALLELLAHRGVRTYSFDFPQQLTAIAMEAQIAALASFLGTTIAAADAVRRRLAPIRAKLQQLDANNWQQGLLSSHESQQLLVASSDFFGDPGLFESKLDAMLATAKSRSTSSGQVRLAYVGVPPIYDDLFDYIDLQGGRIVYNEVAYQFARLGRYGSLVESYLDYTYLGSLANRLQDINAKIKERGITGIIHYNQTFCYRHIENIMLKELTAVPVLNIEGERPGPIDGRLKLRIDSFLEMIG